MVLRNTFPTDSPEEKVVAPLQDSLRSLSIRSTIQSLQLFRSVIASDTSSSNHDNLLTPLFCQTLLAYISDPRFVMQNSYPILVLLAQTSYIPDPSNPPNSLQFIDSCISILQSYLSAPEEPWFKNNILAELKVLKETLTRSLEFYTNRVQRMIDSVQNDYRDDGEF